MTPREKEEQIIARFLPIEDVQERLALLVDRARRLAPFAESERCDGNRIQGCSSRVWIAASVDHGTCRFRVDADSTVVKGLAAVICEVYDGTTARETAAHEPAILEALHLLDHLSPTRRHGLEQVRKAIREFAAKHAAQGLLE